MALIEIAPAVHHRGLKASTIDLLNVSLMVGDGGLIPADPSPTMDCRPR